MTNKCSRVRPTRRERTRDTPEDMLRIWEGGRQPRGSPPTPHPLNETRGLCHAGLCVPSNKGSKEPLASSNTCRKKAKAQKLPELRVARLQQAACSSATTPVLAFVLRRYLVAAAVALVGVVFHKPMGQQLSSLADNVPFLSCISRFKPDPEAWPAFEDKMKKEGLSDAAIAAFKHNYVTLASGANLMIAESSITPVDELPSYESLKDEDPALLGKTVMLKLNGGLGTGMGLEKAKSLLTLKDGATFLDFIAKQTLHMRSAYGVPLAFMLMNSFSTSEDTLKALSKYKDLPAAGLDLEFQQNKAPKVKADDLSPAAWPANSSLEWCPPGHGDLYPAMVGSGTLDKLLAAGFKYMFVSNSDNLGATMDLKLLTWFAKTAAPFAMECAQRTDADKKGGHLARRGGKLLLRESAQCPDEDEKEFQNIAKYKYFNTNNLWVNLEALKTAFTSFGGVLPLPVIKNGKTVDPRDKKSTKVLQLETAMGAAIECFDGAQAILIPRSRFAPVKTTADLVALMSDAYEVTSDHRMILKAQRNGVPPNVKLDGAYKFVDDLYKLIPNGAPSLIDCAKLVIDGANVVLEAGVVFSGTVTIKNPSGTTGTVKAGTYKDTTIDL
jgi:UDP-N-acetylglucosamine pyrophosphorylase